MNLNSLENAFFFLFFFFSSSSLSVGMNPVGVSGTSQGRGGRGTFKARAVAPVLCGGRGRSDALVQSAPASSWTERSVACLSGTLAPD